MDDPMSKYEQCRRCGEYGDGSCMKDHLRELVEGLTDDELRTLRSIINGKISKRKIDPTQQATMQAARKRKEE